MARFVPCQNNFDRAVVGAPAPLEGRHDKAHTVVPLFDNRTVAVVYRDRVGSPLQQSGYANGRLPDRCESDWMSNCRFRPYRGPSAYGLGRFLRGVGDHSHQRRLSLRLRFLRASEVNCLPIGLITDILLGISESCTSATTKFDVLTPNAFGKSSTTTSAFSANQRRMMAPPTLGFPVLYGLLSSLTKNIDAFADYSV